jgi:CO/xanthine dehydrogenase Mo-binding subunit
MGPVTISNASVRSCRSGICVNPAGVEAQMEGGALYGLSVG